MINSVETTINRCQPGYNASCSLCCGSHNYVMEPDHIEEMFMNRPGEYSDGPMKHQEESSMKKLFQEELQCSHVGMELSHSGQIGCLIYTDPTKSDEIESFFNGTCKTFLCPAWYDLTDLQILFAAKLMGDWYYYSLFINNTESVQEICSLYSRPEDVPHDVLSALKEELEEWFIEEDGK